MNIDTLDAKALASEIAKVRKVPGDVRRSVCLKRQWQSSLPFLVLDHMPFSIVEEGYEPPLTTAQADEIDRRLKAHQRNPDDVVDWKAIKTELDSRFGSD